MTQTTTPDKLVETLVEAFLKGFNGTEEAQEAEPKEAEDPVAPVDFSIVNPFIEALRILKELEDNAGDFEDDLRIAIVDRYIEIGKLINS